MKDKGKVKEATKIMENQNNAPRKHERGNNKKIHKKTYILKRKQTNKNEHYEGMRTRWPGQRAGKVNLGTYRFEFRSPTIFNHRCEAEDYPHSVQIPSTL